MRKQIRELFACGLWVAAVALMVFGTIDSIRDANDSPVLPWGIFFGVVACVPTGWCILERLLRDEDEEAERIIEVVEALHHVEEGVSPLRR